MRFINDEFIVRINGRATAIEEGSVILTPAEAQQLADNVLPVYRDAMASNARQLRETARAIETAPKREIKSTPGTLDITPTNASGFYALANEFDRYVNRVQEQMAELQGPA